MAAGANRLTEQGRSSPLLVRFFSSIRRRARDRWQLVRRVGAVRGRAPRARGLEGIAVETAPIVSGRRSKIDDDDVAAVFAEGDVSQRIAAGRLEDPHAMPLPRGTLERKSFEVFEKLRFQHLNTPVASLLSAGRNRQSSKQAAMGLPPETPSLQARERP